MTDQPLNPAAIMAAHRYHRGADDGVIVGACVYTGRHKTTEHCATYLMAAEAVRLAAALAAAQERERRVRAVNIDALIEYEKEAFRQGNRETEEAVGALIQVRDSLRAAPQGEPDWSNGVHP